MLRDDIKTELTVFGILVAVEVVLAALVLWAL